MDKALILLFLLFRYAMAEKEEEVSLGLANFFSEEKSTEDSEVESDSMEVEQERAPAELKSRIKRYIESKSQPLAPMATKDSVKGNSLYQAIFKMNKKSQEAAGLNGAASPLSGSWGQLRIGGDDRYKNSHERYLFQKKLNMSFSFNPDTLMCDSCAEVHQVLPGDGGARGAVEKVPGGIEQSERTVFVLSDHCFPAALPAGGGKDCLKILRIENGALDDLVAAFLGVTRGFLVPTGTVILIASASHLANVGVSAYAFDLVRVAGKLSNIFGGGVVVIPGISLLLDGCDSPELLRALAELYSWLPGALGEGSARESCLVDLYDEANRAILALATGGPQQDYKIRIRLPKSLTSMGSQRWESGGWTGLCNGVLPLSEEYENKFILFLTEALNTHLCLNLDQKPLTSRSALQGAVGGIEQSHILVIGSSHARRLATLLEARGSPVASVIKPHWRARKESVAQLTQEVATALSSLPSDTVVLFVFLDNSFYFARSEDGSMLPHRRSIDGKYHVDGDLALATKETAKHLFNLVTPVLEAANHHKKILLTPLPRYIYAGCCEDPDHISNRLEESYAVNLMDKLEGLRRLLKGMAFTAKIKEIKVINVGRKLEEVDLWGDDPVHPLEAGYGRIADLALQGIADMSTTGSERAGEGRKRPQEQVGSQGPCKRALWGAEAGPFARRFEPGPWRGRGGWGGRRGGGWRGRRAGGRY